MSSNRPLSPHLQVYKPQLTSFTSILHRVTGAALAVGAMIMTWWLWSVMTGGDTLMFFQSFVQSHIGKLMLFGWVLAFCYHFFNGLRHMWWDAGRGITIAFANRSAIVVLLLSAASAVLIWCRAAG